MGVLESVLKWQAMEDEARRKNLEAIPNAINNLLERRLKRRETEARIANIESQIAQRSKGSLIDQVKEANELFTVAKNINNPQLGVAVRNRINNLIYGNQQPVTQGGLLDSSGNIKPASTNITSNTNQYGLQQPQRNIFGKLTEQGKITDEFNKLRLDRLKNNQQAQKELYAKMLKDRQEGITNFSRVRGRVDNIMDEFINMASEQYDISGFKPGFLSGLHLNTLGTVDQRNKFKDAFKGLKIQVAAASGRISLPGSRGGVRMLKAFKETTASEFQTLERAIETSKVDIKNAFVEVESQTPWEFLDMTENEWNNLSFEEKQAYHKMLSAKKEEIADNYERMFLMSAYKSNRNILSDDTRAKLEASFPVFNTVAEGERAVPKGSFFRVGSQVWEAE